MEPVCAAPLPTRFEPDASEELIFFRIYGLTLPYPPRLRTVVGEFTVDCTKKKLHKPFPAKYIGVVMCVNSQRIDIQQQCIQDDIVKRK